MNICYTWSEKRYKTMKYFVVINLMRYNQKYRLKMTKAARMK